MLPDMLDAYLPTPESKAVIKAALVNLITQLEGQGETVDSMRCRLIYHWFDTVPTRSVTP